MRIPSESSFENNLVHSIEDIGNRLKISIPAQKQWSVILYTLLPLIIFTGMVISAFATLLKTFNLSALVWLGMCLYGETVLIFPALKTLTGKEIIEISGKTITLSYQVLGYSRSKEYLIEHVQNLRLLPTVSFSSSDRDPRHFDQLKWRNTGDETLAFDYGAKTLCMARGIDTAEAIQILAVIQQKFPHLVNEQAPPRSIARWRT